MTSKYLILTSFLLLTFGAAATSSELNIALVENDLSSDLCHQEMIEIDSKTQGGYTVRTARTEDFVCQLIEIDNGREIVFRDAMIGGHFYFGPDSDSEQPFMSVTGLGAKNLVISSWSGGAHCCYSLRVFDVTDRFREIAFLETGNYMPAFVDFDGDGTFEIQVADDFLAYRFSSFAESATAEVILKHVDGRYIVAPELMFKPPVDLRSLSKEIAEWQSLIRNAGEIDRLPYPFMKTVTDLIFSGNRTTAERLVDLTWPSEKPSKNEFINEYEEALSESKFYTDFQESYK